MRRSSTCWSSAPAVARYGWSVDATAVVTGGTGGLGAAVTARFLDAGWRVVVPWVASHELERLPTHPALHTVQADLFEPAGAAACIEPAAAGPGAPLRAVVNLVGGSTAAAGCTSPPSSASRPSCG